MLSRQRIVGLRVIEGLNERGLLPGKRGVAGIAPLLERAFVWVFAVAVGAGRKRQPRIARLSIGRRRVAALA